MPNLLTLTIYKITDDPRSLSKNTTGVPTNTFGCNPTENCNVLTPTLSIAYNDVTGLTPAQANYAYVDAFERFYFIKDVTYGTGGKVYFHLAVDVLGTYGAAIKNCSCTVTRSESAGKNYVPDDKYPLNSNLYDLDLFEYDATPFTNQWNGQYYILTTIGNSEAIIP